MVEGSMMTTRQTRRYVLFVLAGVAVLMMKPYYHGPLAPVCHNYCGNFAGGFWGRISNLCICRGAIGDGA